MADKGHQESGPRTGRRKWTRLYGAFAPHYRKQWWLFLLAGFGMVGSILTALLQPWPLKLILDHIILDEPLPEEASFLYDWFGTDDEALLVALALSVIVITFLDATLSYIHRYYVASASHKIVTDIRERVFAHLQRLSLTFHDSSQAGDLVYRLTSDVKDLTMILVDAPVSLLRWGLTFGAITVVMMFLNWWLGLVALFIVPFLFVYTRRFGKGVKKAAKKKKKQESEVASVVSENITAMALVQAYGQEESEKARFDQGNVASLEAQVSAIRLSKVFKRITKILTAVGTALVVYFGAQAVLGGFILPGVLVVFVTYLKKLYSPIDKTSLTFMEMAKSQVSADRILELIENDKIVEDVEDAEPAPSLEGRVEFASVTFAYEKGVDVLQDVSFSVEPGETVALVGHSGAGKSTLVSLLLRFYEPRSGQILIDGRPIQRITLNSLREQMTLVFQDAILLRKTIRENISFGRPDATDAEIVAVAKLAQAHEFITQFPEGYETLVEEGAENLSGGQKQRISIARAILRDSPILIVDEPSTGLDARAEAEVDQAIQHLTQNRTTFVIAHRFSTIVGADRILLLDHGRILEQGTHEELMQRSPQYRELYELQFGDETPAPLTDQELLSSPHATEKAVPLKPVAAAGLTNDDDDPFCVTPFSASASLELQNVRLKVSSNRPELVDYIREHALAIVVPDCDEHDVDVKVLWLEEDEYDPEVHVFGGLEHMNRLGKRLLGDQNQLVWLELLTAKGLQLRVRLDGSRLLVDAIYRFDPSRKPPELHGQYRYKKFFSLMKYFVYFPVSWHLEHFRDIYLLKASAVLLDGKAVLVAGMGGTGKSTTTMALLVRAGAKLISENLVFYDERYIYGCYEPIRADDASVKLVGEPNGQLYPGKLLPRVKEKNLFHVGRDQVVERAKAGLLLIPKFSPSAGVTPLNLDICVEKLLAINTQAREVNAYYGFAASMGLLWPKGDRSELRILELTEVLSQAQLYEFNIDPEAGIEPVVDLIVQHTRQ